MLNLGNKIRELRKKKGLTQEQLANAFGISAQAVSKWEQNDSYPDMAMIPALASFFDVSLDTLFEFDPAKKAAREEEIRLEANNYFWGDHQRCAEILRRGIEEIPSSDKLRAELLRVYIQYGSFPGYTEKAEELAHRIIGTSGDLFAVCSAKSDLAVLYLRNDRYEDAKQVIDSLPYMFPYQLNDRMRCSAYMLKGEDKLKEAKDWKVIEHQELFIACGQEGEGCYETGDYAGALNAFTQAADVVERFMKEGPWNYESYPIGGTSANHMYYYLAIAGCQLKLGNREECAAAIEKAYSIAQHTYDCFSGEIREENTAGLMESYRRYYTQYELECFAPCP